MNKTENNYRFFIKALMLALILTVGSVAVAEAKGRKFALLVGINKYPDTIGQLGGCVNDVQKMKQTLTTRYGFKAADTTVLTDAAATRAAIIANIQKYQKLAGAGDIFVFHYSGHGSLFPDEYSEIKDETKMLYYEDPDTGEVVYPRDKYDANILPVDAMEKTSGKPWLNLILDDELYQWFSVFTGKGSQVVFISDSCFSGSVAKAGKALPGDVHERFVPVNRVFGKKNFDDLKFKAPKKQATASAAPNLRGLYLTLSGANDTETALDGGTPDVRMGLFTYNLVRILNMPASAKMNYTQLMTQVSGNVSKFALDKMDHNQNPRLETAFGNPGAVIFSVPAAK
jgi:hypothetical protein